MIINPKDFKIAKVTMIISVPNYGKGSIDAIDYVANAGFDSEMNLLEIDSVELKLYDPRCYAQLTKDKLIDK